MQRTSCGEDADPCFGFYNQAFPPSLPILSNDSVLPDGEGKQVFRTVRCAMGSIAWFLFVYVLGGVSFIPLLLGLVFLHAYTTFPTKNDSELPPTDDPANIKRTSDDTINLKTATDTLAEQFYRKHESDVAAGYFAVCREYVPGGINGKPPERKTPAGEVVATESPSVYQSMYRSIFDRQPKSTIEPNKSNGRNVKKANNVFFVVLRLALASARVAIFNGEQAWAPDAIR
jgi:hypothetical protein